MAELTKAELVERRMEIRGREEAILFVDATPDPDYPIRILEAHLRNQSIRWEAHPSSKVCDMLNQVAEERAELLRAAIALIRGAPMFARNKAPDA